MKTKLLSTVLGISLLISSCSSELLVDEKMSGDFNSIKVPAGFNWNTSREVNFSIKIADVRFNNSKHVISIYTSEPKTGVNPISKGAASILSPFNTKISVASSLKELYVVRTSPDGLKTTEKVSLDTSSQLNLVLGGVSSGRIAVRDVSRSSNNQLITTETNADCKTGCDIVIDENTPDKNLVLQANKTICLTGNNYTVNIDSPNGGSASFSNIRVCGTNIVINNLKLNNPLEILAGASVTINNINWLSVGMPNGKDMLYANISNKGTLNFTNSVTMRGNLSNYGVVNFNNDILLIEKTSFYNNGTTNVKGSITTNNAMFINYQDFVVNGNIVLNSNASYSTTSNQSLLMNDGNLLCKSTLRINMDAAVLNIPYYMSDFKSTVVTNNSYMTVYNMEIQNQKTVVNKCNLIVNNNITINGKLNLDSYVSVKNNTFLGSEGLIQLYNGALYLTKTATFSGGSLNGDGANYSLFKVINSSQLYGNEVPKITGRIQYAESNDNSKKYYFDLYAKSTTGEGIYIPKTSCNEGNGTAPVVLGDTDNDGIIDAEDSYPNDASKAFDNYSTPSTVAFEDQWPYKGDYDLNDIVLSYSYLLVTNTSNKVVQVKANYMLKAAGGSLENGAGVQFNLPKGAAKNFVSSNGVAIETAGQDSLVVILFRQSGRELGGWNTFSGKSVSPKSYSFSFDLVDGPSLSTFGIGSYNPFIWDNGSTSGQLRKETHLLGKYPTKLMNTKMFGTIDDASLTKKYYSTISGLPWAIEVSTNDFKYPVEFVSISSAYLKFANWATSGGTLSTDWYSNPANRINSNIFNP